MQDPVGLGRIFLFNHGPLSILTLWVLYHSSFTYFEGLVRLLHKLESLDSFGLGQTIQKLKKKRETNIFAMTKIVQISRGMARKRERHLPLRFRLVGQCFVGAGTVLLLVLAFLWSQYLFPTMLDSQVAFDVCLVINT